MNNNSILPADFDGVFRFTNWTDEDFQARWDSVEYTFPAMKTTPIIIPTASPEQIQNIRKKFARKLAEREFYRSDKLKSLDSMNNPNGGQALSTFRNAVTYSPKDLEPFIQRCLEALPAARATTTVVPKQADYEDKIFKKDSKGKRVSRVVDEGESLVGDGVALEG